MSPTQRVKIGVVGCGDIAQIQHLPALKELAEEYEVAAVCDVSALSGEVCRGLVRRDGIYDPTTGSFSTQTLDAVLLVPPRPEDRGRRRLAEGPQHTFIEKPMCYSLREADAIIEAARSLRKRSPRSDT